jgi:undecaprenyl diphosphate synthase
MAATVARAGELIPTAMGVTSAHVPTAANPPARRTVAFTWLRYLREPLTVSELGVTVGFRLSVGVPAYVGVYDRYLGFRVRHSDAALPETVALIITERDLLAEGAYTTLERFFEWAVQYGADTIVVYVSVLDEGVVSTLHRELTDLRTPAPAAVRGPDDETAVYEPIQISIGLGGKSEFSTVVGKIAERVDRGELSPSAIDEDIIEDHLVFPTAPDLVIKTGAERLSDFMIWQSVYSELYFTDVNWQNFRKRDYLRALRDYQERQRRFGK